MYVPFGKSVDDVTFWLSLRHLFCPRLKKKLYSITVEQQTSELRVVVSSPTVGKNFSFCMLSLSTRFWQVD